MITVSRKKTRPSFVKGYLALRKDRLCSLDKMTPALRWSYLKLLAAASWSGHQEGSLRCFEKVYSVRDIASLLGSEVGNTQRTLTALARWHLTHRDGTATYFLEQRTHDDGTKEWVLPTYRYFVNTDVKD